MLHSACLWSKHRKHCRPLQALSWHPVLWVGSISNSAYWNRKMQHITAKSYFYFHTNICKHSYFSALKMPHLWTQALKNYETPGLDRSYFIPQGYRHWDSVSNLWPETIFRQAFCLTRIDSIHSESSCLPLAFTAQHIVLHLLSIAVKPQKTEISIFSLAFLYCCLLCSSSAQMF